MKHVSWNSGALWMKATAWTVYEWVQNDVVFSQASWNGESKWLIYEWQCIAQWKHVSLHLFYTLLYIVFICIVYECNSVWKNLKSTHKCLSTCIHLNACGCITTSPFMKVQQLLIGRVPPKRKIIFLLSCHSKLIFIFRPNISSFHSYTKC